ncbi:MAG: type I-E CRISPR-associated protein Cas6/Cse3/CasE [bacterium]
MSWLVRMEIGLETATAAGIVDSYTWHKRLWDCFPGRPDGNRDFLTRIDLLEGAFRVWVLARTKLSRPKWCPPEEFGLKEIAPSFLSHQHYAFDLRANPVKTVVRRGPKGEILLGANGRRRHGKRVPLVKPQELKTWLIRKGSLRSHDEESGEAVPGGFRIVEPLEISPMTETHFRRKGLSAYHGGVQFRGVLEVTSREHFTDTYYAGIGSAKGFGFGLLLLAPVAL